MTYKITEKCIGCEKCLNCCPTEAITKNNQGKFSIDPLLCNDCEGYYGVAQCIAGCPTFQGCIPVGSNLINLAYENTNKYWQNWFEIYSQKLDRLIHT